MVGDIREDLSITSARMDPIMIVKHSSSMRLAYIILHLK